MKIALIAALAITPVNAPDQPVITLTHEQVMALRDQFDRMASEKTAAEDNALGWYRKYQDCHSRKAI